MDELAKEKALNAELRRQIQEIQKQLEEAQIKIGELKAIIGRHNARGAGRKVGSANSSRLERYAKFVSLVEKRALKEDIMDVLGISLSTYKRYMKIYQEQLNEEESIN